jgi:tetratricopeptide (TPR) repeat protein
MARRCSAFIEELSIHIFSEMDPEESQSLEAKRQRYNAAVPYTNDWITTWEAVKNAATANWKASGATADLDALTNLYVDLSKLAPPNMKNTEWMVKQLNVMAMEISELESPQDADSDKGLLISRLLLDNVPVHRPDLRALAKTAIAERLLRCADRNGNRVLIEAAVAAAEEAAEIHLEDKSQRSTILHTLSQALSRKFGNLGQRSDIERSVWAARSSLRALVLDEDNNNLQRRQELYLTLGIALGKLFDVSGNHDHLDEAVDFGYKSLEPGDPNGDDANKCNALVFALTRRARLDNNIMDLNHAISIMKRVLAQLSPTTSTATKGLMYDHWSRACLARYEMTNQLQNLDDAIMIGKKAVALFPDIPQGRFRASIAHGMLLIYTKKYKRSKKLDDALEGVKYGEMSVQHEDPGSRMLGAHLNQLSILYEIMFFFTTNRQYLQQSLSKAIESLDFIHTSAIAQNNVACRFLVQYKMDRKLEHLDLALRHIELALSAFEDVLVSRGAVLSTAGEGYRLKHEALKEAGDDLEADEALDKAILYSTQAARYPRSLPLARIAAARLAAKMLASRAQWESASQLLSEAMGWIPKLVTIGMDLKDQTHVIASISGLAAEACSAALASGKVGEALEHLEAGRGITVASGHKALYDADDLKEKRPDLYERYCFIRDQLLGVAGEMSAGPHTQVKIHPQESLPQDEYQSLSSSTKTETLSAQMNDILDQIHAIPGLQQFLKPISSSEAQQLCGNKTVVALNNSTYGAHAILVNKQRIWSIPLPDPLYMKDFAKSLPVAVKVMERIAHREKRANSPQFDDSEEDNHKLLGLLAILWQHIAAPVVQELGFDYVQADGSLDETVQLMFSRRVLWLPTGHYSRFPLHAAGMDTWRDTLSAGRRVVSSYIASFRMLRFAQGISAGLPSRSAKGLLLSMEAIEGRRPTRKSPPFAAAEVARITNEATAIEWEVIRQPTRAKMLAGASTCSWLHVACHGISDTADPSNSHLVLDVDEEDGRASDGADQGGGPGESCLTVQQISGLRATRGILAFLSACSTAESRVPPLLDESLSIGYAFQMAGFPHVVGCLWPAYGFACPDFAEYFYRYLEQYGAVAGREMSNDLIAFCVHYAVMCISMKHDCIREKEPLIWAGWVHMGP